MKKAHNLFAYGTLMWGDILESVVGHRLQGNPAVLPGYQRFCVKGECYPALIPSANNSVEGMLYRDMRKSDLVLLDAYEGGAYDRIDVCVSGVVAQVYVLSPDWRHIADHRPWRPEMMTPEQVASFIQ